MLNKYKYYIILAFVVLALLIVTYKSCQKPPTDNTQQLIDEATSTLKEQYDRQLKEKEALIDKVEGKMRDLQNRLTLSEAKYKVAEQRIKDLEKEKANVTPPKTNEERRARFDAAGFPMLTGK